MRSDRSPSTSGWLSLGLLLTLGSTAFAAGCSAGADDASTASAAVEGTDSNAAIDDLAELNTILGDDRVAAYVRANPTKVPDTLAKYEAAYGVGRNCNRPDGHSKEIWVVEEKDTRISGAQVETETSFPRLVIGGCNKDAGRAGTERNTFELFVAIVSDTTRPIDDPLQNHPIESMTLDNTTGLFNFYVFEPAAKPNGPATVTRFVRRDNGVVEKWQKIDGQRATKAVNDTPKCYSCHVHGGPIMNEMTATHEGPWTNWVSSKKATFSRALTGDSLELVNESRPFPGMDHGRSSIADQLEPIIFASLATWVEGLPGVEGSGLGPHIAAGKDEPGGVSTLLKSVLCETEVNYGSVNDYVPVSLFLDTKVADIASLQAPVPPVTGASWTLLPQRSEADKRIETFMWKKGILTVDSVNAARVFDDTHEVFSDRRCALLSDVTSRMTQGATPDAALRGSILNALATDPSATTTAQAAYVRALIDANVAPDARDAAETAYIADVTARLATDAAQLESPAGRAELAKRWSTRQAAARTLFSRAENPLPRTSSAP